MVAPTGFRVRSAREDADDRHDSGGGEQERHQTPESTRVDVAAHAMADEEPDHQCRTGDEERPSDLGGEMTRHREQRQRHEADGDQHRRDRSAEDLR